MAKPPKYTNKDLQRLAIAGYNMGPSALNKLLKEHKTLSYNKIKKYLPEETQKLVEFAESNRTDEGGVEMYQPLLNQAFNLSNQGVIDMSNLDLPMLSAHIYKESYSPKTQTKYDLNAYNPSGAKGLGQFTPITIEEFKRQGWLKEGEDPYSADKASELILKYQDHMAKNFGKLAKEFKLGGPIPKAQNGLFGYPKDPGQVFKWGAEGWEMGQGHEIDDYISGSIELDQNNSFNSAGKDWADYWGKQGKWGPGYNMQDHYNQLNNYYRDTGSGVPFGDNTQLGTNNLLQLPSQPVLPGYNFNFPNTTSKQTTTQQPTPQQTPPSNPTGNPRGGGLINNWTQGVNQFFNQNAIGQPPVLSSDRQGVDHTQFPTTDPITTSLQTLTQPIFSALQQTRSAQQQTPSAQKQADENDKYLDEEPPNFWDKVKNVGRQVGSTVGNILPMVGGMAMNAGAVALAHGQQRELSKQSMFGEMARYMKNATVPINKGMNASMLPYAQKGLLVGKNTSNPYEQGSELSKLWEVFNSGNIRKINSAELYRGSTDSYTDPQTGKKQFNIGSARVGYGEDSTKTEEILRMLKEGKRFSNKPSSATLESMNHGIIYSEISEKDSPHPLWVANPDEYLNKFKDISGEKNGTILTLADQIKKGEEVRLGIFRKKHVYDSNLRFDSRDEASKYATDIMKNFPAMSPDIPGFDIEKDGSGKYFVYQNPIVKSILPRTVNIPRTPEELAAVEAQGFDPSWEQNYTRGGKEQDLILKISKGLGERFTGPKKGYRVINNVLHPTPVSELLGEQTVEERHFSGNKPLLSQTLPIAYKGGGSIPISSLGQWKYPGQTVKVPSNNITMQGISHPNLGVGDNGMVQMMLPGMNYKFPGAKSVIEIPMLGYGGSGVKKYQEGNYVLPEVEVVGKKWESLNPKGKTRLSERIYNAIEPTYYPEHAGNYITDILLGRDRFREKGYKSPASAYDRYSNLNQSYSNNLDLLRTVNSEEDKLRGQINDGNRSEILQRIFSLNDEFNKTSEEQNRYKEEISNLGFSQLADIGYQQGFRNEDMWRMFLGLPQFNDSVIKSKFRPTSSSSSETDYFTIADRDILKKSVGRHLDYMLKLDEGNWPARGVHSFIPGLSRVTMDMGSDERGDYISLYDIYDFSVPGSDKVGNPYEIYDRVYFDELGYTPEDISKLKNRRVEIDKEAQPSNQNIFSPVTKYQAGDYVTKYGSQDREQLQNYFSNQLLPHFESQYGPVQGVDKAMTWMQSNHPDAYNAFVTPKSINPVDATGRIPGIIASLPLNAMQLPAAGLAEMLKSEKVGWGESLSRMTGLDGRQRSVSESLGIENPYLAFGTDVVLDPANLIGSSIITNPSRTFNMLNKGAGMFNKGIGKTYKAIEPVLPNRMQSDIQNVSEHIVKPIKNRLDEGVNTLKDIPQTINAARHVVGSGGLKSPTDLINAVQTLPSQYDRQRFLFNSALVPGNSWQSEQKLFTTSNIEGDSKPFAWLFTSSNPREQALTITSDINNSLLRSSPGNVFYQNNLSSDSHRFMLKAPIAVRGYKNMLDPEAVRRMNEDFIPVQTGRYNVMNDWGKTDKLQSIAAKENRGIHDVLLQKLQEAEISFGKKVPYEPLLSTFYKIPGGGGGIILPQTAYIHAGKDLTWKGLFEKTVMRHPKLQATIDKLSPKGIKRDLSSWGNIALSNKSTPYGITDRGSLLNDDLLTTSRSTTNRTPFTSRPINFTEIGSAFDFTDPDVISEFLRPATRPTVIVRPNPNSGPRPRTGRISGRNKRN